jgi:hypothetical protein
MHAPTRNATTAIMTNPEAPFPRGSPRRAAPAPAPSRPDRTPGPGAPASWSHPVEDAASEGIDVPRRGERTIHPVIDDLPGPVDRRGNHRAPGDQRLRHHLRKAFPPGSEKEHVEGRHQVRNLQMPAEERKAIRHPDRGDSPLSLPAHFPVADHHEPGIGDLRRHAPGRLHEIQRGFLRLEHRHRSHHRDPFRNPQDLPAHRAGPREESRRVEAAADEAAPLPNEDPLLNARPDGLLRHRHERVRPAGRHLLQPDVESMRRLRLAIVEPEPVNGVNDGVRSRRARRHPSEDPRLGTVGVHDQGISAGHALLLPKDRSQREERLRVANRTNLADQIVQQDDPQIGDSARPLVEHPAFPGDQNAVVPPGIEVFHAVQGVLLGAAPLEHRDDVDHAGAGRSAAIHRPAHADIPRTFCMASRAARIPSAIDASIP